MFCAALALFAVSLMFYVTSARFVTEIGGDNSLPYETQTPFDVDSQTALINAIKSGYGYVKLSDSLTGPIIMSGEQLNLKRDLTIDLNGKEIQRTSTDSLLNVTEGNALSIVDTSDSGSGGLYNPVGSVLTVSGGNLNVYSGIFESGPRPSEYYSKLVNESVGSVVANLYPFDQNDVQEVTVVRETRDSLSGVQSNTRTVLPIRGAAYGSFNTGSIYFDVSANEIARDTYCYTVVKGGTADDFSTFYLEETDFAYSYYINTDGEYVGCDESVYGDDETLYRRVMVFGFCDDIAKSVAVTSGNTVVKAAPNYAAVKMQSGELNVDVLGNTQSRARIQGSFYSYFGTWQTSCIYITGGTMNVSTTGELATVNPAELPAIAAGDTNSNSAKYGEGACIFSESDNPDGGGTLNITKLASATSYNGSVISVSGGTVNISEADIIKTATISHSDDPFALADVPSADGVMGSEFPADRQYRDAAIFINGGTLSIQGRSEESKLGSTIVEVYKNITDEDVPHTTFGILSRGRSGYKSEFNGSNLELIMHGGFSYGIFGTRGTVNLTDSNIMLDSDSYSYGVFAVNKTSITENMVNITLENTDVTLGNTVTYEGALPQDTVWVNSKGEKVSAATAGAMRAASIGVYLDSHEFKDASGKGGSITMDNSSISSQEVGVSVYCGNLTFKNGSGISAYNASAITLRDGNILFEDDGNTATVENYDINSYINRKGGEVSTCEVGAGTGATNPANHQYEIYIPYQRVNNADGAVSIDAYENQNGIRVMGGSLISEGKLTVNFRGLYNDYDKFSVASNGVYGENYNNVVVKSFAVACIEGIDADASDASIRLDYADITSSVGGGVKVQGGAITLGKSGGGNGDVKVTTTGKKHLSDLYQGTSNETAASWKFRPSLSGGFAVIARGGSLTANCGTYTTAYANAAAVTADDPKNTPEITINGGVFIGNLEHEGSYTGNDASGNVTSKGGPMSHYGLMVMGASNVNINGGDFNGKNGGLYVRGSDAKYMANVYIKAGIFGTKTAAELKPNYGQDGINLSDYTNAYFGTAGESEAGFTTAVARQNALVVNANYYPIAINTLYNAKVPLTTQNINVYIYYGKYTTFATSYGGTLGMGAIFASKTKVYVYGVKANSSSDNTNYVVGANITYPKNDFVRNDYANQDAYPGFDCVAKATNTPKYYPYTVAPY